MKNSFWQNKHVFVTGASGIVGSWLVRTLADTGAEVVVLVHDADPHSDLFRTRLVDRTRVVNGRLEDLDTLKRAINEHEIDTVIHLGAQTIVGVAQRSPWATLEANVRGTYNLLEACRQYHDLVQRVVIASSDKAYGENPNLPYVEEMPLQGRHPYEVSKSCADLIAQAYHHTYDLPVAIARCGNIYGGGDLNWSRIVPGTIRSFLRGEQPVIRSNGQFVRDYIYVEDVVRAYVCLAERLAQPLVRGEAYNFSTESRVTVLELVEAIRQVIGVDLQPLVLNSAPGELHSQYLSAAKAKRDLDWSANFTLEQGLQRTIRWYEQYLAT
jgi:CDP-glucose 4,6-dehydratase